MPRNLHDLLAKNILHDVFSLRGLAQTEAEVPPGNARRIDLWFVPEHNARTASAPEFAGILAEITAEPSAHEVWCDSISVDDFFAALVKRELWRDVLEQRDKHPWPRPMLWHHCAGKPERVLEDFGYESVQMPGLYTPLRPGLRTNIVVISELPKMRDTLLLRLLGKGRVRQEALRELRTLPELAWEKQLAHHWLVKVGWEVPVDRRLAPEDNEVVMDIKAWYKDFIETHDREVEARVARDIEARVARDIEPRLAEAQMQGKATQLAHQFERRVGRPLSVEEREMLATRIKTDGSEHLADLVLDLSGPELAAWLEKNGVARSD